MRKIIVNLLLTVSLVGTGVYGQDTVQVQDNWNQMDNAVKDGYHSDQLKLSMGWLQQKVREDESVSLWSGRFEYMTNNYFGFRGETAIPISSTIDEFSYFPLALGLSIHVLPNSPVDVYFGGDSGYVNLKLPNTESDWFARTSLHAGITYYFLGVFFLEYEARFDVLHYAKDNIAANLSGLGHNFHMGIYF